MFILHKIYYQLLILFSKKKYYMKHTVEWYNEQMIASGDTKATKVSINILGFEIERKFDPIKSNKFFEKAFKNHFKKKKY
jgi:hypothetical protein